MPTKFMCWNRTPNVTVFGDSVFGRWWGHQGGICMNETSAFFYEAPGSWAVLSIPWGHLNKCRLLSDMEFAGTQPPERRDESVICRLPRLWYLVPATWKDYNTHSILFLYNFISSNTIIVDKVFDFLVFDVSQSICVSVVLTFLLLYKIPLHDD